MHTRRLDVHLVGHGLDPLAVILATGSDDRDVGAGARLVVERLSKPVDLGLRRLAAAENPEVDHDRAIVGDERDCSVLIGAHHPSLPSARVGQTHQPLQ